MERGSWGWWLWPQYDVSKSDGEPKWVGESSVCGKWRGAVKERLTRQDAVFCKSMDFMQWRKEMLERTIFEAVSQPGRQAAVCWAAL